MTRHVPGPLPDDVLGAFWERCRADLAAAGKPEHVEDPQVLARIARIVAGSTRRSRPRKTETGSDATSGPHADQTTQPGKARSDADRTPRRR